MPDDIFPEILKPCDIRGTFPKPLGASQAERIGRSVGTLLKESPDRNIKAVVGQDVRLSGDVLKKALLEGLLNTGLKVVDIGTVSTPLLAFASRTSQAGIGIMVTASHNPPEHNGFKFFLGGEPAPVAWIERLYKVLGGEAFKKGAGILEKKDFFPDYRNALVNSIAQNFQGFKLVVDPGNGANTLTAPKVLEALHFDLEVMNGKPDGRFPGRGADSSTPEALEALGAMVRRTRSRLGVAFDGDGDRVSFTDEKGREVPNDVVLCLFAKELARKQKNLKVVYDGKCADWVEAKVEEVGGKALLERSGHTFIHGRMAKEKALLGGESSGHFFLPGDFTGDALYAALRLLLMLKEGDAALGQWFDAFPPRVSTHDIKLKLPLDQVVPLYEGLKGRAQDLGAKVSLLDGVRAVFKEGWGIVRRSVTEPVLSCRFEAPDRKKLGALVKEWFRDHPEVLRMIQEKID
jgi:phosphomannomutase/phosphoglucomutase